MLENGSPARQKVVSFSLEGMKNVAVPTKLAVTESGVHERSMSILPVLLLLLLLLRLGWEGHQAASRATTTIIVPQRLSKARV